MFADFVYALCYNYEPTPCHNHPVIRFDTRVNAGLGTWISEKKKVGGEWPASRSSLLLRPPQLLIPA